MKVTLLVDADTNILHWANPATGMLFCGDQIPIRKLFSGTYFKSCHACLDAGYEDLCTVARRQAEE